MAAAARRTFIPLVFDGQSASAPGGPLHFRKAPPLSLYVHVPWCVKKCPYCDFNSHALAQAPSALPEADYLAALITDVEMALPLIWGRRIESIFFGGGTPSLLSGEGVDQLLAALRSRLSFLPGAEITLEANPGTLDASSFAAYRAAGINRLSLGIQSFTDRHLRALGRIHDARQAREAIEIAVRHFDNFNLDLMYGLPGQTIVEALDDVDAAMAFAAPHLSCYQLTIEANTAFAANPPSLPNPDICAEMQDACEERLAAAGYLHYETSAFAQADRQCRHNLNYWHFGDYLGIGAGAHSKLTLHDRVLRQMRWKHPGQYLAQVAAGAPLQEEFSVLPTDLPVEFMMNALRLLQGVDLQLFEQRTSLPATCIERELRQAQQDGLLEHHAQRIVPTDRGQRFLNRLLERFLVRGDHHV